MLQTMIKVKSRDFSAVLRGRILLANSLLQKPLLQNIGAQSAPQTERSRKYE
jgi:hypothetical protein